MATENVINLTPTEVHTITLGVVNKDTGLIEAPAVGDVFKVVSPNKAISATLGVNDAGAQVVIVRPVAMPDSSTASVVIPVTDSAGNTALDLTVNYPVPPATGALCLNMAGDVVTTQPMPPPAAA